ncbi:tRNA (guanosine(46)-N7)-methyltransferase TrmB [candidate division KSB1 bacterium]|nr:tRNA (guanosine(46)-N7)-methyltransferase TrmB [candidate division KSB1 bacterium]
MPKNKLQKFAEFEMFPNTRTHPMGMKGHWNTHFFTTDKPITLELACGRGEYSLAMGRMFPDRHFIGIDKKGARLWVGAKTAFEQGLENVGFVRTHIEFVDTYFKRDEVSEIWLPFPDPQPGASKANKRLSSPRFLKGYERILQTNGKVHLKTDSDLLYEYTLETLEDYGCKLLKNMPDLYSQSVNDPLLTVQTTYEKRHLAKDRVIKYVCWQFE